MLISDLAGKGVVVVDRQIVFYENNNNDKSRKGRRADLLVLKRIPRSRKKYQFVLYELKSGDTPDFSEKKIRRHIEQMNSYVKFFNNKCISKLEFVYRKNLKQKKELGLIDFDVDTIEIDKKVDGKLLFVGFPEYVREKLKAFYEKEENSDINKRIQLVGFEIH